MKNMFVLMLAGAFLFSGIFNIMKQIKNTCALDEIVRFINLVKTEVRYRISGYEDIYLRGKAQNYKYISFSEGEIYLNKTVGIKISEEFNSFIKKIGTTDEEGQISLCNEFKERFEEALLRRKTKEKEKIQVNTALSVFCALAVLIFFL